MKPRSLRGRLLAGMIAAQLLLAIGLVWAGIAFTQRQLRQAFDATLAGHTQAMAALVRYPEKGTGLLFDTRLTPPPANAQHPPLYQIGSSGRGVVASTFPASIPVPAAAAQARYWEFRFHGASYRGIVLGHLPVLDTEEVMPSPLPLLTVSYAAPTTALEQEVAAAGIAIALVSLLLLALTSWLAAWLLRRELTPLRALARQAGAISPNNWSFTPPAGAAASELVPLIGALQRMLARMHDAHRQQLAFLADTAHHLKTPVAIIKSTQQMLLQRPRGEAEYRAMAEATLQDTERLEQLLQRMLHLARLDAREGEPAGAAAPASDLASTLLGAMERVRPLARAAEVELTGPDQLPSATVPVAAEDLEQVWVNLLENAIQHSPPGSVVWLQWAAHDDSAIAV
ncbi:MAG: sensor histidine kinase, partial [Terriglobales bacterium]